MADVLTLGGFQFDEFSTPSAMPAGGDQAMVIHKLPGGARVIDTLGPDEADINWSGFFWGNDAFDSALFIDSMRVAGNIIPLTWAGQFRSVIIKHFVFKARRWPVWVEYDISCMVYRNPQNGSVGAISSPVDTMLSTDLSVANDLSTGGPNSVAPESVVAGNAAIP